MDVSQAHHADCDHVLGYCALYPAVVILCPHGSVQAGCEACLDDYLERQLRLAELEEELERAPDEPQ